MVKKIFMSLFAKTPSVFLSIDEMTLWHYMNYLKTNDLRWFSDYFELANPKPINIPSLQNSLQIIYGQMLEYTQDPIIIENYRRISELLKLSIKFEDVTRLVNYIKSYDPVLGLDNIKLMIAQLKKWRYKINENLPIFEQVETIEFQTQAIASEIQSLKAKIERNNTNENIEIEDIIFNTQVILELKYKIEPKETTLKEWLVYQKNAKKIIEKRIKDHGTN